MRPPRAPFTSLQTAYSPVLLQCVLASGQISDHSQETLKKAPSPRTSSLGPEIIPQPHSFVFIPPLLRDPRMSASRGKTLVHVGMVSAAHGASHRVSTIIHHPSFSQSCFKRNWVFFHPELCSDSSFCHIYYKCAYKKEKKQAYMKKNVDLTFMGFTILFKS